MQVYRGLPMLTNQDAGARLVGIWPLDRQGTVGEYPAARARGDRRDPRGGADAGRRRRLGPLVPGGADDVDLPPDVPPDARARWERLYDRRGAATAPRPARAARPARRRARARERPQARRPRARAVAGRGDARAASSPRLWTAATSACRRSSSASRCRETLAERIHVRDRGDVRAGRGGGGARCRRGRAAGARAATRSRTLPRAEAIAELVRATRRFAAYQRKWMRRIPGIVMIDADRPAGEVADAILEVARAR